MIGRADPETAPRGRSRISASGPTGPNEGSGGDRSTGCQRPHPRRFMSEIVTASRRCDVGAPVRDRSGGAGPKPLYANATHVAETSGSRVLHQSGWGTNAFVPRAKSDVLR